MANVVIATMDSLVGDTLSSEISGEGHDVVWVQDGLDACDQVLAQRPALVFLDEELPVFNAFEVAVILRGDPEVPKELPIFLLSDATVEPHRLEQSGFTGLFRKTHGYFELRELLAARIDPYSIHWVIE